MKKRVLKILISAVLVACLAATPAFALQNAADEEMQNQEGPDQETWGEIFQSIPEQTPQDFEESADSWRYEEGETIDDRVLEDTEVLIPDEVVSLGAAGYGDKADKYWTVGGKKFSGGYLKGIDVSVWQGKSPGLRSRIDWSKVKTDVRTKGVYDFVIIRCGYGRNTRDRDDSEFSYNVGKCEEYGIPYGVYLYSYAENNTQARSEAAHALRLLKGHYPDYPVYYDLEDSSILRATGSSRTKITAFAKTFCSKLDNNGYRAGIYANLNWFSNYIDKSKLKAYDMWVAQWPGKSQKYNCGSSYSLWQCSSGGSVSGICGRVDINLLVKSHVAMEEFMSYSCLPKTLKIEEADRTEYSKSGSVTVRQGPGRGYHPTGVKEGKRAELAVTGTANGYSEITDSEGNTGWITSSVLVAPGTPWGFEKISEGEGEETVTKTVLKSYADQILKNRTVKFSGYVYGADANGEKIVAKALWTGNKRYTYDEKGHAYISRSKTTAKTAVYEKAGSVKKGTLAKGKYFYVLKKSGD